MYPFLLSLIPNGASSQQFHLLLASILSHPDFYSSLSTSPQDRGSEHGGSTHTQQSLSKSLYEALPVSVNAVLVDELMSLSLADNLNASSFSDIILRAQSPVAVSLGHLLDNYAYPKEDSSGANAWNTYKQDIILEGAKYHIQLCLSISDSMTYLGRLLMTEIQNLCEENFSVGMLSSFGINEGDFRDRNSSDFKITALSKSCRRQLYLPSGGLVSDSIVSSAASNMGSSVLSIQPSESTIYSGTSFAPSSDNSMNSSMLSSRATKKENKEIKSRRSYFKESVLTSKVLYPKETEISMNPISDKEDDGLIDNQSENDGEPPRSGRSMMSSFLYSNSFYF